MKVLTEINVDCSFMQTIIKLPQNESDLKSVIFNKTILNKLLNYINFTENIKNQYKEIKHLIDFIDECLNNEHVYYVKTFSEDIEDLSDNREFICFGEYHRNSKAKQTLLFRIDQNWVNFKFPIIDDKEFFKTNIEFLSGATINTIFSDIILEQEYLNNTYELISTKSIYKSELENLFLISIDYYGKSYFIDKKGEILYLESGSKKIKKTEMQFKEWIEKELNELYKPKYK